MVQDMGNTFGFWGHAFFLGGRFGFDERANGVEPLLAERSVVPFAASGVAIGAPLAGARVQHGA